jgi:hypothetical protein
MSLGKWMFSMAFLSVLIAEEIEWEKQHYWQNSPLSLQDSSLLFHNWSIYSQLGEEGVLDEILKRLNLDMGNFVECSAFYGAYISKVRFLADRGWRGIFVDVSARLKGHNWENSQPFRFLPPILCLEEMLYFKDVKHLPQVQFIDDTSVGDGYSIHQAIDTYFQDREVDILSIDLGGLDYLALENLQYRPKIIIITAGLSWTPLLTTKIPLEIASYGLNQPIAVLIDLAQNKGYAPLCYMGSIFFIRNDLLFPFQSIKKDSVTLWLDFWYYCIENRPSYISWIINSRNSNNYVGMFDLYPIPPY